MWRPERVAFVGAVVAWWRGRRCYGRGCYAWWVQVVPAVGLVEDVGWLDRPPAYK
jgi:hypothetical protein